MIEFRSSIGAQRAPVFELSYEINPPAQQPKTKRLAFSIAVRSRGLCFVCCPKSVERLRGFFTSAFIQPSSIPSASSSILKHWTLLKDRTTKQLKSAFEQIFSTAPTKMTASNVKHIKQGQRRHKKNFEIYLDICAPQMIIPQSSDRALVMDFGYLTFINDEYQKSSCPLQNCDMHNTGSNSPSSLMEYFQQRPYFFTEQRTSPLPSTVIEDDPADEEFLTPDGSPLANDGLLEQETTNYPVNIISREHSPSPIDDHDEHKNLMYSAFSLSLCDMQLGYLTYANKQPKNNLSPIIEKFGVCFLIRYRTVQTFDPLYPLIKVSGILPKIIIHLDPSRLETLCGTINNWGSFVENLTSSIVAQSDVSTTKTPIEELNARLSLGFRINEISIQLSDDLRALAEIRIQNIDLTLMNHIQSNILSFSVHTLMIVDALQNHGKDFELLLTSNRALDINTQTGTLYESNSSTTIESEYLIRINIQSSTDMQTNEQCLTIDIHVNKLHFLFNPETLSILINFFVNVRSRMKTILRQAIKEDENEILPKISKKKSTRVQIHSEFQELSILLTNVLIIKSPGKRFPATKLEKIAAARIQHASLNISFEPSTLVKAEICALQIFNLFHDHSSTITHNEQSSAIIDLGIDDGKIVQNENKPSKAFHLIYTKSKENHGNEMEDLLIEMASVCYTHSPKIIYKIETIMDYMAQHCHSTAAIEMERMKNTVIRQGSILLNQYMLPTESGKMITSDWIGMKFDVRSLDLQSQETTHHLNLSIILATPILIFRPQAKPTSTNDRLVFHLGDIHVENSANHVSNYDIEINDLHLFSIDLDHEYRHNQGTNLLQMFQKPHLPLPILDNISIHLNLKLTDISTTIDSKLVSFVQMFLGKHQITLLQNIISSITYNENNQHPSPTTKTTTTNNEPMEDDSLILFDHEELNPPTRDKFISKEFRTFAINFQLPELIVAFQADLDLKPIKVCQATFGQFQMAIEKKHPFCTTVSLRLDSLHLTDHLVKVDQCLFSTRCRKNSSSNYFQNNPMLSSSLPTENHSSHGNFLSSSVPAYMVSNDSSTWTLTSSTSPMRIASPAPPAFIDINITLMDPRHEQYRGFNIIADAEFGEVNIEFIITPWVMLFDIIGLIGGTPSTPTTG